MNQRWTTFADMTWGPRPIWIVDIDGTLADGSRRVHFVQNRPRDWKSYFEAMEGDTPVYAVQRAVQEAFKERTICIVSGRPDDYQARTIQWLNKYEIPFDWLIMRPAGDHRDDTIVKKEILELMLDSIARTCPFGMCYSPKSHIEFVWDDRPKVIRMWKEQGLRVIPVRGQCEEF